jgi:hypothetical protein
VVAESVAWLCMMSVSAAVRSVVVVALLAVSFLAFLPGVVVGGGDGAAHDGGAHGGAHPCNEAGRPACSWSSSSSTSWSWLCSAESSLAQCVRGGGCELDRSRSEAASVECIIRQLQQADCDVERLVSALSAMSRQLSGNGCHPSSPCSDIEAELSALLNSSVKLVAEAEALIEHADCAVTALQSSMSQQSCRIKSQLNAIAHLTKLISKAKQEQSKCRNSPSRHNALHLHTDTCLAVIHNTSTDINKADNHIANHIQHLQTQVADIDKLLHLVDKRFNQLLQRMSELTACRAKDNHKGKQGKEDDDCNQQKGNEQGKQQEQERSHEKKEGQRKGNDKREGREAGKDNREEKQQNRNENRGEKGTGEGEEKEQGRQSCERKDSQEKKSGQGEGKTDEHWKP